MQAALWQRSGRAGAHSPQQVLSPNCCAAKLEVTKTHSNASSFNCRQLCAHCMRRQGSAAGTRVAPPRQTIFHYRIASCLHKLKDPISHGDIVPHNCPMCTLQAATQRAHGPHHLPLALHRIDCLSLFPQARSSSRTHSFV